MVRTDEQTGDTACQTNGVVHRQTHHEVVDEWGRHFPPAWDSGRKPSML